MFWHLYYTKSSIICNTFISKVIISLHLCSWLSFCKHIFYLYSPSGWLHTSVHSWLDCKYIFAWDMRPVHRFMPETFLQFRKTVAREPDIIDSWNWKQQPFWKITIAIASVSDLWTNCQICLLLPWSIIKCALSYGQQIQ